MSHQAIKQHPIGLQRRKTIGEDCTLIINNPFEFSRYAKASSCFMLWW